MIKLNAFRNCSLIGITLLALIYSVSGAPAAANDLDWYDVFAQTAVDMCSLGTEPMMHCEPAVKVSAKSIYREFENNQVAAVEKYDQKMIYVTGIVRRVTIDDYNNQPVVEMAADSFVGTTDAEVDAEEAGYIRAGQSISLFCHDSVVGYIGEPRLQICSEHAETVDASEDFIAGYPKIGSSLVTLITAAANCAKMAGRPCNGKDAARFRATETDEQITANRQARMLIESNQ